MSEHDLLSESEAYLDGLFGAGAGHRHTTYLDALPHSELREQLHRAHAWAARDEHLSVPEHYLIGMSVLYALRAYGPAGMFARTLLLLDVSEPTVIEAVARLAIWIGPVQAGEAAGHLTRAIADYHARGLGSMDAWLPGVADHVKGACHD